MSVEKPASAVVSPLETDGALARTLLREATVATLATTDRATGAAYASLVEVATSADATPVLLLSGLARHTANLKVDSRASLLVDSRASSAAPMTAPRATFIGRLRIDAAAHSRDRFLRRHPASAGYADFGDFKFWSLAYDCAHLIQGFGRIREIPGDEIRALGSSGGVEFVRHLMRCESELVRDLNIEAVHIDSAQGTSSLIVSGIDIEGLDLIVSGKYMRLRLPVGLSGVDDLRNTATMLLRNAER